MDSATQFLLGASISGAAMGPRLGARALLIGGLVATLPDLDSLIQMGNEIDDMTYHRGASHSVLVQTAAAPVIALAVTRVVREAREHWKPLLLTVWLCLVTHSVLDSLTTYGTQILWPLDIGPPVALPSIFIIDPLYSGLLLAGVLLACLWRRRQERAVRAVRVLLLLSTVYLGVGVTGHLIVQARAESHPDFAGKRVHVQPAPFNILFWQVLAVDRDRYVTGLTSLIGCPIVHVSSHERLAQAPNGIEPPDSARRLEWFTDGFYTYQDKGDTVAIADLRIGFHPNFVFSFAIARRQSETFAAIDPVQIELSRSRGALIEDLIGKASESLEVCPA